MSGLESYLNRLRQKIKLGAHQHGGRGRLLVRSAFAELGFSNYLSQTQLLKSERATKHVLTKSCLCADFIFRACSSVHATQLGNFRSNRIRAWSGGGLDV